MSSLILSGGQVVDPANNLDEPADVLVMDGKIAAVSQDVSSLSPKGAETVDCSGKVVSPGLIDMNVHLREPGMSAKETIETGTRAAAKGGFTSVICMPNTSPVIDSPGTVALVREKAEKQALVNVFITGAITKGTNGEEMSPIGSLKQAGVVAITDDFHCVQNNELMRRAMEYALMFGLPVIDHCQDYSLVTDGVANDGYWSTNLGLRGWPTEGEEMIVARNALLAEKTGCPVHCQHVSAAGSVRLIREAKSRKVPISGEACPHHFTLTDSALGGSEHFWTNDGAGVHDSGNWKHRPAWPKYDTMLKMNPPLRSNTDREAILEGICDGTLEVIASDHAPHCDYEKEVEFDYAPIGITGLETALALTLAQLHHSGRLSISDVLAKFTCNPARLLHLDKGTLSVGADADITVIDPNADWQFEPKSTASKSTNSPFYRWPLKGRAERTFVAGKRVWPE